MTKKEYVERNIGMTFDFIDKDMPVKIKEETNGEKIVRYKVEHVFEPIKK